MKALFSRLKSSKEAKDKDRLEKEKNLDQPFHTVKSLPDWPLPQRATSTPVTKPLPELSTRPLPAITDDPPTPPPPPTPPALPPAPPPPPAPVQDPDSSIRSTTTKKVPINSEQPKKVAFISPPPTPGPELRPLPDSTEQPLPSKSVVAKLVAAHTQLGSDTRGSTSTANSNGTAPKQSMSKVTTVPSVTKATSTRSVASPTHSTRTFGTLPMPDGASTLRSMSPYSQMSSATALLSNASWSERAEEDLVINLGQRERTRQEVLLEIVASEDRYVIELLKLKETFIDPLLHPYSSVATTSMPENEEYFPRHGSPQESLEQLPIAARFLNSSLHRDNSTAPSASNQSTISAAKRVETPMIPPADGESLGTDEEEDYPDRKNSSSTKLSHPRSPYGPAAKKAPPSKPAVPFPSARSHTSLPPPQRANPTTSSTSLGRQSFIASDRSPQQDLLERKSTSTSTSRVLRKFNRKASVPDATNTGGVPPHQLPEDIRKCLEVIERGMINGHMTLAEGLKKRYEEQYPLVRSLADVFVSNSHILHEYATYVLHLERALDQVESLLSSASMMKRPKNQDAAEWQKLSKLFMRLEENAADKGETGLAISLSKPFQRLLKYPLLFQNLLFHTDPSTFEYESTLQMVSEVEDIVRSIEDEKIQKEERDKTRDVFARIEGLEKVKLLAVPKPSRLLVEERLLVPETPASASATPTKPPPAGSTPSPGSKTVKQKTSFRRISEVLQPSAVGGKKDLWLVVFNDVVLRCQRTGTTTLPMATTINARAASLPDLQGKSKYATTGRQTQSRPRNMYKFIKIENWAINDMAKPREGIVSMEDIEKARQTIVSSTTSLQEDEEDGNETDESDRKSKMSFSYWGADKITVHTPQNKARGTGRTTAQRRVAAGAPSSFGAVTATKEYKFGTRMRSPDLDPSATTSTRPASRRHGPSSLVPPGARRATAQSEDSAKATATKPAWNGSTRETPVSPVPHKRVRNTSQTSGQVPRLQKLPSVAPSEDSGVGFYRQILAADPTLSTSTRS